MSAEHASTAWRPSARMPRQSSATMRSSHGQRSSSVSGCPTPSWRRWPADENRRRRGSGQSSDAASARPTVDLPQPDTPITTRIIVRGADACGPGRNAARSPTRRQDWTCSGECTPASLRAAMPAPFQRPRAAERQDRDGAPSGRPHEQRCADQRTRVDAFAQQQDGERNAVDGLERGAPRWRSTQSRAPGSRYTAYARVPCRRVRARCTSATLDPPNGPPSRLAQSTSGSTQSAAIAFCHNARVSGRCRWLARRVRTVIHANVKPDRTPQPSPCRWVFRQCNSGTSNASPTTTSADRSQAPRLTGLPHSPLEQRHEQRKARVAEQADRHGRHLNGREESDPVQREERAVADHHRRRGWQPALPPDHHDGAVRSRPPRCAPARWRRRPRDPLAEEPREAEQHHRGVQCQQGRGGG